MPAPMLGQLTDLAVQYHLVLIKLLAKDRLFLLGLKSKDRLAKQRRTLSGREQS
jgi:hypothetical protein